MAKIDKTMTPVKSPQCKKCKGKKVIKTVKDGVEKEMPCPVCGGTGVGKIMTK